MTGQQTVGALVFSGFVVASPAAAVRCLANPTCRAAAVTGGTIMDLQNLATSDVPIPIVGRVKLPENPAQIMHIFRNDLGHLANTAENQKIVVNLVNNVKNIQGLDKYGNTIYTSTMSDGSQVWALVRNGVVQNGGINNPPRVYVHGVGLR